MRSEGITPPFLASTLDGLEWSAKHPSHINSGKDHTVSIRWENGYAPEPVWMI
jgi:hypothetical protein